MHEVGVSIETVAFKYHAVINLAKFHCVGLIMDNIVYYPWVDSSAPARKPQSSPEQVYDASS